MELTVSISTENENNRLELLFTGELSLDLTEYLKELGFRVPRDTPQLYYVDRHPAYLSFAKQLQKELEQKKSTYKDIVITPSFTPSDANIDHDKFSYVTLTYTHNKTFVLESYVVFEPYLKLATIIAQRFGVIMYQDRLIDVNVKARQLKGKSRKLLTQGKVITAELLQNPNAEGQTPIPTEVASQIQEPVVEVITTKTLTNDHGVYTKETAGDRLEIIEIPIPKTAKFDATITIVQDENDKYRFGTSTHKNFGDHSGESSPVSHSSTIYLTRQEVLQLAFQRVISVIQLHIDGSDTILSNQKKKNALLNKALKATVDFAKEFNITLEGLGIETLKSINESPKKEAKKTTAPDRHQKLSQLVLSVSEQLYELADQTEKLADRSLIGTEKIQFDDALEIKEYDAFVTALKQIISDQQEQWINRISAPDTQKKFIRILNPLAKVLKIPTLEITATSMHSRVQDSTPLSNDPKDKASEQPLIATEKVSTNIQGEHTAIDTSKVICTDIIKNRKLIRNIILPKEINPPFDSGDIKQFGQKQLQKQYPDLCEIKNHSLKKASAIQLFQLVQLKRPKDFGIGLWEHLVSQEWNERGFSLFSALGYPTELTYPYKSITSAHYVVLPLHHALRKHLGREIWASVAASFRPVGNIQEEIDLLEFEIQNSSELLQYYENAAPEKRKQGYNKLTISLKYLKRSKQVLQAYIDKKEIVIPELETEKPSETTPHNDPSIDVRSQLTAKGFTIPFTGMEAIKNNLPVIDLAFRWHIMYGQFEEKNEANQLAKIKALAIEKESLKEKGNKKSRKEKKRLEAHIEALLLQIQDLEKLIKKEDQLFHDELLEEIIKITAEKDHDFDVEKNSDFSDRILPQLLEGRMIENYPNEPIQKIAGILVDDYFSEKQSSTTKPAFDSDYLEKVIAIMQDHYMNARRLTKKQVEAIQKEAGVPNKGMLWEAVELSWLLWYKFYYEAPDAFEHRLGFMIRFWNEIQPSYAYSDSSKEIYKQYSTPCPIGAIIAEYTEMTKAASIFEPSAGNGLLVIGADPQKTHVNEVDHSRRKSLEYQGFKTITHWNAAQPFPKELSHSFDVMVTNPPFSYWEADDFDKKLILRNYFNDHQILRQYMRLEHLMTGLALHTLKDSGKAAIIIMGHVSFETDGHIAKYRRFFNWLYKHYRVDDIININSFKMYHKQGTVKETMLILISGRKPTPKGAAPRQLEAPHLTDMVHSFQELSHRVRAHIKSPLQTLIQKLKIANGYDIF